MSKYLTDELIWHVATRTIPAAFDLLPARMMSKEAIAMLLAIGLQESAFQYRTQINGPAHGFWQFEKAGGVKGVLEHPSTLPTITGVCDVLAYPATSAACYAAIVDNDVLACCFARLLLWASPSALPGPSQPAKGWAIYLAQWRPGKPHPATWNAHYQHAWTVANESKI
jgi:hypothetical protein